jgi:hypothetical protein
MNEKQRSGFGFYVILILLGVIGLTNLQNPRGEIEKWRNFAGSWGNKVCEGKAGGRIPFCS